MKDTNTKRRRVVIVGAGFGGLTLARALEASPFEVVLIDRENYHLFQPLLYQVATAGLEPEEIAHAVRGIFQKQDHFRFLLGSVDSIDAVNRSVRLANGASVDYDFLVLAAGAVSDYFGIEGAERYSFPLKRLDDATWLRSHVIRQFERVEHDPSLLDRGALTFTVVGGGPTGVELAGALTELFQMVLRRDFPDVPVESARVVLVEAVPNLLSGFHESSQAYALRQLRRRGVEVRLTTPVTRVTDDAVFFEGGERLATQTLIWAAGVRAHPLAEALGAEQDRGGRVVVAPDLSLPDHPEIFVIGDMAAGRDEHGDLHPQVAPVAIQGARHVAHQLGRRLRGEVGKPFIYRDRGIMATIGRNAAVAELGHGVRATGFAAWVMWLGLHLMQLVGFRNRLNVLINWAWNYVTYDRSARLILDRPARRAELDLPRDGLHAEPPQPEAAHPGR